MTPQFKGVKVLFISMIKRYLAKRCDQLVTVGVNVKEVLDNHRIRSKSETISIQPAVLPLKLKSKKTESFRVATCIRCTTYCRFSIIYIQE
jgi:RNase P subunit RPR2